jgi:hypothetical protein
MTPPYAALSEADYGAIENALLSTEKGRRFLIAYADRNRGTETVRLLRSLSRLHRAALGAPGAGLDTIRDLTALLKQVSLARLKSELCGDDGARALALLNGLDEIESGLIVLIEALDERMSANADGEVIEALPYMCGPERDAAPRGSLYGELSSLFSSDSL